ncbi:MAG: sugar phosphate isomerase/epimerase [Candidatus Hydrogenedentes bacterium]|nr:sugar phosphate isomerase/epimerase [Candidatus Hydrogenedentota bacterium]
MKMVNRREFLVAGAAALPAVAWAGQALAAKKDEDESPKYGGFRMGSQSYSFRYFKDPAVAIEKLKELGLSNMEFCSVHFKPDASDPGFAAIKALIASTAIAVPVYGVEGFGQDEAANRKKFEFAKALGLEVISADVEKEGNAFKIVDALCKEFNIKIGIHNHGPGARYDKVSNTIEAVKGSSALVGACVDTGHVIRSGEKPHEVIAALGERVHSLHLKDWVLGGKEQIVGEGDMDLVAVAKALKAINFSGPIMLEYEEHESDPVPHMKKGLENWQKACDKA